MPDGSASEALRTAQVERLLEAAAATIAEVPFCWVVTAGAGGGANARIVKTQTGNPGEDRWTRWFLTPRAGRKAAEIARSGRVTLAYQHVSGSGYVALAGHAELIDDRAEVDCRFGGSDDDPDGTIAARLIAVRVNADHLELHLRGVTAEPWGHGRTLLDRAPDGSWRFSA